ncbi:hypothetical protein [Alsobacter sp. R-9]
MRLSAEVQAEIEARVADIIRNDPNKSGAEVREIEYLLAEWDLDDERNGASDDYSASDTDQIDLVAMPIELPAPVIGTPSIEVHDDEPDPEPVAASPLRQRVPWKHTKVYLKDAKHPLLRAAYEHFEAKRERQEEAKRLMKRTLRSEKAAEARQAPRTAIEREARKKLAKLYRTTRHHRTDKAVQQIVGREREIVAFWTAMQLAALDGKTVTDAAVAAIFLALPDAVKECTKSAARQRRLLIARLEERGLI